MAWLLAHPDVWRDVPSDKEDVTVEGRVALEHTAGLMTAMGLYSARALPLKLEGRRWGLRVLIGLARQRLDEDV